MNIGQKIKVLREKQGVTLQEIGDLWGISRSSVAGWESGAAKPGIDKLPALARRLGTTIDELLSDRDLPDDKAAKHLAFLKVSDPELANVFEAMDAPSLNPRIQSSPSGVMGVTTDPDDPNSYRIQKVKLQLRAGVTGFQTLPEIHDGSTINLPKNWVDRKGFFPESLIAISVAGDSMEPRLFENDVVVINTADRKLVDGEVYAVNYEGEAIIKRLVRERGEWWLFSDNPDQARHRPRGCREGECNIIGRVVWKGSERI